MSRTIFCHYQQCHTDGLDFIPWPGELGQRLYTQIGKTAWNAWLAHQTMLINENRLSPRDPKHRAFLEQQMIGFLFEGNAAPPEGYQAPAG